jgi:hypothetical protein
MRKAARTKPAKVTTVSDELSAHDAIVSLGERWGFQDKMSPRAKAVLNAAGSTADEFRRYLAEVDNQDLGVLVARLALQRGGTSRVKARLLSTRMKLARGVRAQEDAK